MDDLLVATGGGGFVFAQIKHAVFRSRDPSSPLASTLDQFVRQFITSRTSTSPGRRRSLDAARDRLLLVTGPGSSAPIRKHLPSVLLRLRSLAADELLENAAANDNERRALQVVLEHARRSWQRTLGGLPEDYELRELLSLVRIHSMDVDAGGEAEREAKDLLRLSILRDPEQADSAWATLVQTCAGFAQNRSGADRAQLQQVLLSTGFELNAPHSYRDDIERLREHSQTTAKLLADLSRIRFGTTEIKIHRVSTSELRQAAGQASLLVVGDPGAGKSGALYDVSQALQTEGRDVVFLAADHIAASSLPALRGELGLTRDLSDVLANWPGREPAFLIIDALDAARADPAARALRDLIQRVIGSGSRWRVVASIRKFDLQYSQELQRLFVGLPPTEYQDPHFAALHHLNIPRLTGDELSQIRDQSDALWTLVEQAPIELLDLLRVPFNLRLIAEMLGEGANPADLTPIRTQIELLDRYWLHRVIGEDRQGDAREVILRRACEGMVAARALRVDRALITDPAASSALADLLSSQVLTEWQAAPSIAPERYVLTFSHHVLFDYSVARLLLRGDPTVIVNRLVKDPELVVFIRPSLLLHFYHVWTLGRGREVFWNLVFRIVHRSEIPEIGKLIGLTVAADCARELSDLDPLFTFLGSSDATTQAAAGQALGHLIGALLAGPPSERALVGAEAGPWCEVLERASRTLRRNVAYPVGSLLWALCEQPGKLTAEQLAAAGITARRLLDFAWAETPRDSWLVLRALQCVCRTFQSDPAASAELLRRSLAPANLDQHGFEEMYWVAREVKPLIRHDPALCAQIYRAVFGREETSKDPTDLGKSRILSLTSTRQQDWGMASYQLAEAYPALLAQAAPDATRVLIAALEAYVARKHPARSGEINEQTFDFDGHLARIRKDFSEIWDSSPTGHHEEPLKMLEAFDRHLERLAGQQTRGGELHQLVQLVARENRLAVLWRRLLLLGTRFPDTIGREIKPLARAKPILIGYDTTTAVGEFLRVIYPTLPSPERELIERALLSIPQGFPTEQRQHAEKVRNRLLGCLAQPDLVTEEAGRLLAELRAASSIPANEPRMRMGRTTVSPYREEDYLADAGVPVEAEANKRIRELERPVNEFGSRHLNSPPSLEEAVTVLPALQSLRKALGRADTDGVHPKQRNVAWGTLAAACERIARTEKLSCEHTAGAFTREVLLEASRHAEPQYDPELDAQFNETQAWGGGMPRTEAAQGLTSLARHSTCATHEVLERVETLSSDSLPEVRFQVAGRLVALYRTSPEIMWRITQRCCREEPNRGVLQGLLDGVLAPLAGAHADQVVSLTSEIFRRVTEGPGVKEVRELCLGIFTGLYVWRDHPGCREILFGVVTDPGANSDEANRILLPLRSLVTHGPVEPSDPNQDAIRHRALDLVMRLLRSARDGLSQMEGDHAQALFDSWPEADQQRAQRLASIADHISQEVYFASGAFDSRRQEQSSGRRSLGPEERKRFYREAASILDDLADLGFPSVAHHLLETLETFVACDPRGVFLRVGRVVRAGERGGYQYESLAAELIVRLVGRYLAEYRALLRENEECRRTLLELLDTFVRAGWPSARRLTYRLEEIFR